MNRGTTDKKNYFLQPFKLDSGVFYVLFYTGSYFRELCSILCNNLNGKRIWKKPDTWICITESLFCTPESYTMLFSTIRFRCMTNYIYLSINICLLSLCVFSYAQGNNKWSVESGLRCSKRDTYRWGAPRLESFLSCPRPMFVPRGTKA